jgi:hypothetical protein
VGDRSGLVPRFAASDRGHDATGALPFVQVIGMMVGVYAYGYYLLAREPKRYCGLIWIALAGKTFGPLGFLDSAATGALPWSFGWICLFNDVIWWPVFWRFALTHARERPCTLDKNLTDCARTGRFEPETAQRSERIS